MILILTAWLCIVYPVAAQDDITFTASVDRASLSTDQTLTLQLTLAGTFRNAGKPQLPTLDGFAVVGSSQSSQFSLINGKMSSQVNFTYRLQPIRSGTLTIPAIPMQMGGKTYQTEPVTIEVTQGAAPEPQQPGGEAPADVATPGELSGQDLYVEAEVDNPTPFVGEQVVYTFRLYQGINFFNQPRLEWPEFTNFIGYDITPNTQYNQTVAGRDYLVTEVRRALFPTTQGQVSITPAMLIIPGDFFNQGFELKTNAVDVNVHPLPDNAPAGFNGAVGKFAIEAWVDPIKGRVNEPVTLFVRVSGTGNVNTVPDPTDVDEENLPGWRMYDPQITTDTGQQNGIVQGTKTFERLLVPKTEGTLNIPAFELVFFDPEGMYRTTTTDPIAVLVSAGDQEAAGPVIITNGKQDVVVLGSDIRHIKAASPALVTTSKSLLNNTLYWIGWLLPLLAVAGTWAWDHRRHTLKHDVAYARLLRARRLAHKRLVEATKLLKSNENAAHSDAPYSAVASALTHYLGDKLNLPAAGLTRDAIRQTLEARDVSEESVERLLTCLDWADSGRFAPAAGGRNAGDLVEEAEAVIAALEEAIS